MKSLKVWKYLFKADNFTVWIFPPIFTIIGNQYPSGQLEENRKAIFAQILIFWYNNMSRYMCMRVRPFLSYVNILLYKVTFPLFICLFILLSPYRYEVELDITCTIHIYILCTQTADPNPFQGTHCSLFVVEEGEELEVYCHGSSYSQKKMNMRYPT